MSEELEVAISAVMAAGEQVLDLYEQHNYTEVTKEDESPVTEADELSNEIIKAILKEFDEENKYAILSEEDADDLSRFEKDRVWILDPLDGTKEFIKRNDEFCVMLALLVENELELGVVFAPALDAVFFAQKGFGAYMIKGDNEPVKISTSNIESTNEFRMLVSRSHVRDQEKSIAKELGVKEIIGVGSGYKTCVIASGNAEIAMNLSGGQKEWDIAAPAIILQEAGGYVCDKFGKHLMFNKDDVRMNKGVVAVNNKKNIDKIVETIKNNSE